VQTRKASSLPAGLPSLGCGSRPLQVSARGQGAPVEALATPPADRAPAALPTFARAVELMQGQIAAQKAAAATVLIDSILPHSGDWRTPRCRHWRRSSSGCAPSHPARRPMNEAAAGRPGRCLGR